MKYKPTEVMPFKKKKDDIYIAALKYGKKKLANLEEFTREELRQHLLDKGYSINEKSPEHIIHIKDVIFEQPFGRVFGNSHNPKTGESKWWLNLEGYFQLLEYEELHDARESSKWAIRISAFAILISIITLGASIYYSNRALNEPLRIESQQLEELTKSQFDYSKIEKIIEILETEPTERDSK